MFADSPKLDIKLTKKQQRQIALGWIIIAVNFLIAGVFYHDLPDSIPTHFNYKGDVDGYGDKDSIWTLPLIMGLTYALLALIIKKVKPWNMNYPVKVTENNAPEVYKMSLQTLIYINLLISIIATPTIVEIILLAHKIDLGFKISSLSIIIVAMVTLLPIYFIFKMFKIAK
ncbi:uncharacterized protein DUF1648 [Maribacter spongiicola]|uniref:Uncharacterized protein DUF1648 n=1 Tax=Maribacter spongiicola TaxID=1206753 RepID=A0A4R7K838_9FLAO|nr:DUF1648 domain-containing protein [Maribacter spongiicola]TDT47099.1 uncharacterized protein DUF1648 [Maribacter spongiicola]